MKINVTEKGSLKIYNGLVSGFSSSNYLEVTPSFNVSSAQNWEMVYKIITSDKITTGQTVCGHTGSSTADPIAITTNTSKHFALTVSSSTSSSFINAVSGTYTMLPNTAYWLKVTFDGSKYVLSYSLDGINFTEDVVKENTKVPYTSNLVLGRQQGDSSEFPFLGTIDLNECYIKINGELWWTGMVEGGIKPVRSYVFKRRETTKDDYDVVKIVDSFYSLRRKGEINYSCYKINDGGYTYYYYSAYPITSEVKLYKHKDGPLVQVLYESDLTSMLLTNFKSLTEEELVIAGRTFNRYRAGDLRAIDNSYSLCREKK